jgi:hypothetical protein
MDPEFFAHVFLRLAPTTNKDLFRSPRHRIYMKNREKMACQAVFHVGVTTSGDSLCTRTQNNPL